MVLVSMRREMCLGVWEFGSLGVWEFGSLGVWEFGSLSFDFFLGRSVRVTGKDRENTKPTMWRNDRRVIERDGLDKKVKLTSKRPNLPFTLGMSSHKHFSADWEFEFILHEHQDRSCMINLHDPCHFLQPYLRRRQMHFANVPFCRSRTWPQTSILPFSLDLETTGGVG